MRYSRAFIYTLKESRTNVESVSHDLSLRAGLIQQVAAGSYDFLPLGTRVIKKIEAIIREEMNRAGALEVTLPIMQPAVLWQQSGRWEIYGDEMFKLKSRNEREFCLGPTHEELIVDMVKLRVHSYRDLPFTLYQFGTKFRDEKRPRGGLLRAKEFSMKDAYSFDADEAGLEASYQAMRAAYLRILSRVQVKAIPTVASTGEMGGSYSEEFMAPSSSGEDRFVLDKNGVARKPEDIGGAFDEKDIQAAIEICHIFKLGTRYSEIMGLTFQDSNNVSRPVIMGCYGIGVSRMVPTVIEQHHDERGIIWPLEIAPFRVAVVPINYNDPNVRSTADSVYANLAERGHEPLLDDRQVSPGVKFSDIDLMGIPLKVIVGPRALKEGKVELERRDDRSKEMISLDSLLERLERT